jgi:hypothetical protein
MKQKTALEILKTGRNVFLTGSAGTGKTYILNEYIQYLKERGIFPSIVAPTGIAASHIGGMTIHSFFGIGIKDFLNDYEIDLMTQREYLYNRFKNLKILIIDEISMVSPSLFELMDKILRAFKLPYVPFGGVQIVLSGDFFQLPPISKQSREIKFACQTSLWKDSDLKVCYLEEKFRQKDDVLVKILDEIRGNNVSEESMKVLKSCYYKELFGNVKFSRLYTHNKDVNVINDEELDMLDEELKIFNSVNKGVKKDVERIFNTSFATSELRLKKGAIVLFIKNNQERGYINGTLGKIIRFDKILNSPVVETFSGDIITAEPMQWEVENKNGEIVATVRQVPLKLAWAITVHKSQGMTLDAAEIDLSKTFEVGQGYVALSRIKSISGLRLLGLNSVALQVDKTILYLDKVMKKMSDMNAQNFSLFNKKEKQDMNTKFVIKNKGTVSEIEIKSNRKDLGREKPVSTKLTMKKKKGGTLKITKKLMEEKKNIAQIVKERKLSEKTILKHVEQIAKKYPELDIDYLEPKKQILNLVNKAIKYISKENNRSNFLEGGQMKLRAIYDYLDEKVSYEDIKLAIIFISLDS